MDKFIRNHRRFAFHDVSGRIDCIVDQCVDGMDMKKQTYLSTYVHSSVQIMTLKYAHDFIANRRHE